jgi:hypothetical protein
MFKFIRTYYHQYWLKHTHDHLIPKFLVDPQSTRIAGQVEHLLDQIQMARSHAGPLDTTLLKLERILGPYPSLEEAHRHCRMLQKALHANHVVDPQYLTFANQSIVFRDWLTNEEGYYLNETDLQIWFGEVRGLLETLEKLTDIAPAHTEHARAKITGFLFRIQDTLISIYQVYMKALSLV